MKDYKKDFPIFSQKNITYLDSGATSQKPQCVINALSCFYEISNANPHRGVYALSADATEIMSNARKKVAKFIGAEEEEIVFTKNATESANLVAYSYALNTLKKGDEIVLSIMEHHSNLVPWQMVAKKRGCKLVYMYLDKNLTLPQKELEKITQNTKLVCITALSNVLGYEVNLSRIVKKAHLVGAKVVCDSTQIMAHKPFNVKSLDVDFAFFSGHKMYGPLGVGVLFGKRALLDKMEPFLFGGDMIEYVDEKSAIFASLPHKFEGGTQSVAEIYALGVAVDYLQKIGFDKIALHEKELYDYAIDKLKALDFVSLYVPKKDASAVISFNIKGVHPHDVSSILDESGVCIRSGNHCAQPLHAYLGLDATCRVSFGIYNDKKDIDNLILALNKVQKIFGKYTKGKENGRK